MKIAESINNLLKTLSPLISPRRRKGGRIMRPGSASHMAPATGFFLMAVSVIFTAGLIFFANTAAESLVHGQTGTVAQAGRAREIRKFLKQSSLTKSRRRRICPVIIRVPALLIREEK